jgi:hypothetical protein
MKKFYRILPLIFLGLFFMSCAGSASVGKSGPGKKETAANAGAEDLSMYRPKFKVPETTTKPTPDPSANPFTPLPGSGPTNHVNHRVASLIDTLAILNKSVRYAQGFRILAYAGTERKTAMDIRTAIIGRVPEERDYLEYRQPTFRLKIGDYFNRIEAQQVLQRIKDITPNALIVADQINIK